MYTGGSFGGSHDGNGYLLVINVMSIICSLLAMRAASVCFAYKKAGSACAVGPAFLLAGKGAIVAVREPLVRKFFLVD